MIDSICIVMQLYFKWSCWHFIFPRNALHLSLASHLCFIISENIFLVRLRINWLKTLLFPSKISVFISSSLPSLSVSIYILAVKYFKSVFLIEILRVLISTSWNLHPYMWMIYTELMRLYIYLSWLLILINSCCSNSSWLFVPYLAKFKCVLPYTPVLNLIYASFIKPALF